MFNFKIITKTFLEELSIQLLHLLLYIHNQCNDFYFFNHGFWTPSILEIPIWTPCYENPGEVPAVCTCIYKHTFCLNSAKCWFCQRPIADNTIPHICLLQTILVLQRGLSSLDGKLQRFDTKSGKSGVPNSSQADYDYDISLHYIDIPSDVKNNSNWNRICTSCQWHAPACHIFEKIIESHMSKTMT